MHQHGGTPFGGHHAVILGQVMVVSTGCLVYITQ
jgi:hypothetical protein